MRPFALPSGAQPVVPRQTGSHVPQAGEEHLGRGLVTSGDPQPLFAVERVRSLDAGSIDGKGQPAAPRPIGSALLPENLLQACHENPVHPG